ncbi:Armadillo-like helical domain-containing protein 2 [Holothuria leucospilota]|uniref:Armadillo-like helical domain-containing protein 2 n=1 Tax=Holothuria leucospilota TaxID=206669 RepID=A0A9Q1HAA8_HOLLE|nr:Armadillo-like helical domain-containing protein 2 [Holothuria leucospilota]
MFQSVRRAVVQGVEKTWHTLASHTGEGKGEHLWDKESNLFKRDILMNGQLLGENIDVEVRIEAIRKIGILAYTGGLDASKLAGMYLERMVAYFQDTEAPPPLRLQVIKSIAEMCRTHKDNVQTIIDLGVAEDIIAKLRSAGTDFSLVRWGCYTLVGLCAVSLVILKSVQSNYGDEELKKKLQVLSDLSWHAWPRNYALVLMDLIGFTNPNAEEETCDDSVW